MEYFVEILGYIFFAVALNMDSLGVGFSYGLRRINIPFISVLFISFLSMAAIIISMLAGQQMGEMVPTASAAKLGGLLLIIIGIIALYQYYKQEKSIDSSPLPVEEHTHQKESEAIPFFRISVFGLIFLILRKPHKADMDMSGTISFRESFLLGLALAMDSLAAGVAAALIGYDIIITAMLVGLGHLILLYIGLSVGKGMSTNTLCRQISALPSLILILLGVTKAY